MYAIRSYYATAARLRRVDEQAEIIMFEKGEHISYANCGLPYYIGGVIQERERLLVQTPESFSARFNIDVRVFSEVIQINSKEKIVTRITSYNVCYTKLLRKCITYDIASIKNVYKDGYENGYTVLIIPGLSDAHLSFAINAPDYKQFATKPLIGWISGVQLDELSKVSPKTYFGPDAVLSVITSYSIHYTKLYDFSCFVIIVEDYSRITWRCRRS